MSSIAHKLDETALDDVNILVESSSPSEDNDILIPQYISKNALYSACFCVFPNCILTYIFGYERMNMLFCILYISTMLHWRKVKNSGVIKIFDICVALLAMYRITFIERFRLHPTYQPYWIYVSYIMSISFIINEYIFYMRVKRGMGVDGSPTINYTNYIQWPLSLLNYTHSRTKERENAYYNSVYTHIVFLHLLPTISFSSLIVLSYYKYNADLRQIQSIDLVPEL